MSEKTKRNIDNTWRGIGRLGKLHFVFNTYNMAIRGFWFRLIAIYDGYNNKFIVVSDLYNEMFCNSSREALLRLFAVFGNENHINMIEWEKLYQGLRNYPKNTKDIGLLGDCEIVYIHSSNMQNTLNEMVGIEE